MVGNLYEWVADWVPRSAACGAWSAGISPTDDEQCLVRGGAFMGLETQSGPFAISAGSGPSAAFLNIGFRCAR